MGETKGVKARLVAHRNLETSPVRSDSPTIGKSSLRIQFAVAAQYKWKIETSDVKAAFLQGSNLPRKVHVVPPSEANEGGNLWLLLKPMYGLDDSGRMFYLKIKDKLFKLGCKQSKYDAALFYFTHDDKLHGLLSIHVDDANHCGTELFYTKIIYLLKTIFKFGSMSKEVFKFLGWNISHENGSIVVSQQDYMDEKIELISIPLEKRKPRHSAL